MSNRLRQLAFPRTEGQITAYSPISPANAAAQTGQRPPRRAQRLAAISQRPPGILVSLAGQPVPSVATLQSVLAAHKPGDPVQARVARDGTQSTVQLTLSNLTS